MQNNIAFYEKRWYSLSMKKKKECVTMKIQAVLIDGFKNLSDVKIAFDNITALVALNNFGKTNVLVVSIHLDAKGIGTSWFDARGFSARVSPNASAKSKQLASYLFDAAQAKGLKMRSPKPGQKWWTQNLAICRDTNCAAVLTESGFMDNKQDVEYLLSDKGREAIINLHVNGIINYIKSIEK